jgi:hypothetical protein
LIRKLAVLGAAVAMPLALLIPSSGAAAPAVDVSNDTVACNTLNKGVIKIKPPLINGGTAVPVFSVSGKLAGCSTSAAVAINDFKSSFKGTLTGTSNDCAGLLDGSGITGSIVTKWNAPPKITPTSSTITITAGDVTNGVFSAPWGGAYGRFQLGSPPGGPLAVSGAFTGGDGGINSTAVAVTQEDITVILAQCAGKGVKALTIGLGQLQQS